MNHDAENRAGLTAAGRERVVPELDPEYRDFFGCFNQQQFFEAHEVLESLWLEDRHGPDGNFYKALIQVAGAFVHLQKDRRGPAAALLRLAISYLAPYPGRHRQLDVIALRDWIAGLLQQLGRSVNPLLTHGPPRLDLLPPSPA